MIKDLASKSGGAIIKINSSKESEKGGTRAEKLVTDGSRCWRLYCADRWQGIE
jgi:hypothetical protein